jgi:hypothetical protein
MNHYSCHKQLRKRKTINNTRATMMICDTCTASLLFTVLLLGTEAIGYANAFITPIDKRSSEFYSARSSKQSSRQMGRMGNRWYTPTNIWSTKEEKGQEMRTEKSILEPSIDSEQHNADTFLVTPTDLELEVYEVVDTDEEYDDKSTTQDLVITNEKSFKNDNIMKMMRSEIGVKSILQNDLKSLKEGSFLPDSSSLPLDVLMERTLDTFEDIAVHLRRIPFEKGEQQLTKEEAETRKTVVVLGSGWAAHALMKVVDCRKIRLIIVSPVNHFVFTPMLASAAVGTVEYRSMTEAVRAVNPCLDGSSFAFFFLDRICFSP